ncbi:hypothetical protein LTR97_007742 [Elasticomyces elasticus]|uniref:DUF6536 domain-containing protein n=1 Tax=Elasticomyces elasticus TaxID=574655 RepID=A0AAN8A1U3_9PEZI|nr:hypothetical protein LTR97_007742 [Elasticomyces elasticus]
MSLTNKHEAREALIHVSPEDDRTKPRLRDPHSKWKTTVSVGAGLATCVLAINIAILAWTQSSFANEDGMATVFEGSCNVAENVVLGADLAINVLSTLLLGASNHNAQLLSAPTRSDVDRQHARGGWLDVGVSSMRNFRYLPRWRLIIWTVLVFSTVPLHLLYNSVAFTTRSAVDYQAALVTEDFVKGSWWDRAAAQNITSGNITHLTQMQDRPSDLVRLDNKACLQAYATSMYQTDWRNVLVVTSLESTNSSLINVYSHTAAAEVFDLAWPCGNITGCDTNSLLAASESWTISKVPGSPQSQYNSVSYNLIDGSDDTTSSYDAPIKYCLAETFPAHCAVHISSKLLIAVIVCNVCKIACMLATLCARGFRPLVNIGDAVASFLERPDPQTFKNGALEVGLVSSGIWRNFDKYTPMPWTQHKRRWFYAVPRIQLNLTFFFCAIAWFAAAIALGSSAKPSQTHASPFSTFGAIDTNNVITNSLGAGLIANVVLANTPQLILSFIYIFYNDAFTRMLMSYEWAQFAETRKALRVSRPRGKQRSTYWLQLPLRYSIPMMMSMVLLHWLVSRSIFLVRVSIYDDSGSHVTGRDISACGFSPLAILLAFMMLGLIIAILVGFGRFRYIDSGIPAVSSCSAAISAAAHPSESEPEDGALQPLQYGVMPGTVLSDAQYGSHPEYFARGWGPSRRIRRHVGFSSKGVDPLEDGMLYW